MAKHGYGTAAQIDGVGSQITTGGGITGEKRNSSSQGRKRKRKSKQLIKQMDGGEE